MNKGASSALAASVAAATLAIWIALQLLHIPATAPALTLSLGAFAGFASTIGFALALMATTVSQWPPVAALILRPPLISWGGVTALSIGLSFAASLTEARPLTVTAISAVAASAMIGTIALVSLLSSISGRRRRHLHGRLLAKSVMRMHRERWPYALRRLRSQVCDDFIPAAYADAASDTRSLICCFEALINAADEFVEAGSVKKSREAELMLRFLLDFEMLLPTAFRRGEALDEFSMLIAHASSRVAVLSGRLAELSPKPSSAPAHWLGAQTRIHNWISMCLAAIAEQMPLLTAPCDRLLASIQDAQTMILRCVDPDPPLEYIPEMHPWRAGLRDQPLETVMWFASTFEYHGALANSASLYVLHETLLNAKTTLNFNYGTVLREIERGVNADLRLRSTFAEWDGFTSILFDVLANALATAIPATWWRPSWSRSDTDFVFNAKRAHIGSLFWIVPHSSEGISKEHVLTLLAKRLSRGVSAGFDCERRRMFDALGCMQPPWPRTGETPIFHVAAAAMMLAMSGDPATSGRELAGYGRRIGPAGRRASLAVLDLLFDQTTSLPRARTAALSLSREITPDVYAQRLLTHLGQAR